MQIEFFKVKHFKNLNDFEITLDSKEMKTVLIGQNASGKSNFLEALVLIFKHLDFDFKKSLDLHLEEGFNLRYSCYNNKIDISYSDKKWVILVNEEKKSTKVFIENKATYLPRYILAYYSGLGNNNRLEEHFEDHKEKFARAVVNTNSMDLPEFPRMQYVELIHSQFSLFSFFIDEDEELKTFLKDNLFIEDIRSTLLPIKEPDWASKENIKKDPKFWGSTGVVRAFLDYLHDNVAIAPLRDITTSKKVLWKKEKKSFEIVYLYFSDFSKIRDFVKSKNWSSFDFFHVLNTANVSRLFFQDGIRIRVKKKFADKISFKDLSEGEQQLLTVLGLMRFTSGEETLFLLDEPDTHLNPYWRWKYMDFIDDIVFGKKTSKEDLNTTQVIMTSHDPLTIGSLRKEAVRIFETDQESGKINTIMPTEDPKGMGVAGILTEIFRLETTLDEKTQEQLETRRHLESMQYNGVVLTPEQQTELDSLNGILSNLGISRYTRDPLYQKFQARFDKLTNYKKTQKGILSEKEITEQNSSIDEILKKILEEDSE